MNADDRDLLARSRVVTRLPAEERPGGQLYRCGGAEFALFRSAGTSPGTFTQMGWDVDDIEGAWFRDSEGNLPSLQQSVF
ncbi:hypothetical protein [Streptomyces olivochromogenes]|uniref:Uncharacterized protein n=1 Tax=Streptomyces olivochromogenes TaxID=1963 RepID=A0A250VHW6_STROL|nr:hypothetical protein SO3561_05305 [Streptomyces olivochromogenes]